VLARGREVRPHFRFEDLEIWQLARDLAVKFNELAERLEAAKYFRYAEQLRSAGLSVSNNIAEGAGSYHEREFRQFLNFAKRSLFEDASMLLVFDAMGVWEPGAIDDILGACDKLSRMITKFLRSREMR